MAVHSTERQHSVVHPLDEARSLAHTGEVDKARVLLAQLGHDQLLRPQVKVVEAELEFRDGRYSEAIIIASQAIRLGAGESAFLIRANAELAAHRPIDATRDFRKVLTLSSANVKARTGLAAAQRLIKGEP